MARRRSQRAHDIFERLARHRTGLAALSVAEATVLPVPLEAVVVPLMVGHPRRAMTIATAIWLGALAGAAAFYGLAALAFDPVVRPALDTLGLAAEFDAMTGRLDAEGVFWTVFLISLLPAPMQLATLGAGAVGANLAVFMAAIALSRGVRYFGLALVAQVFGTRIALLNVPNRILIPALMGTFVAVWAVLGVL